MKSKVILITIFVFLLSLIKTQAQSGFTNSSPAFSTNSLLGLNVAPVNGTQLNIYTPAPAGSVSTGVNITSPTNITYGSVSGVKTAQTTSRGDITSYLNYSGLWNAGQGLSGVHATINNVNGLSSSSYAYGGTFTVNVNNPFSMVTGNGKVAGVSGVLSGSAITYSGHILAGGYFDDQINSSKTFAGYFNGKGYFSGNVGIGTATPKGKLTIGSSITTMVESSGILLGEDQRNFEMLHSSWGSGFGSKIYNEDEGNGVTSLRIATRNNTNIWTDRFYLSTKTGNIGIGANSPEQKLQISNGSLSVQTPLQGNDGIVFKNISGTAGIWGDWGIQYWQESEGKPAGLNFWKPWANTAQNNGTGVSANYILFLQDNGKVQIGDISTPGNYKLYVKDGILTEKIKVALNGTANWADFVFDDDYKLRSLQEVENFIKENKHLPGIPSAKQLIKEGGIDVNQMFARQMEKIEELMLYIIELNKKLAKFEDGEIR